MTLFGTPVGRLGVSVVMALMMLLGSGAASRAQSVQAYTVYPRYQQETPPFRVTAEGTSVPVAVFEPPTSYRIGYYYAHFSFAGSVKVTVSADRAFEAAPAISPLAFNLTPTIAADKKSFSFNLSTSRYLILTIPGYAPLVLAADPPEEKPDLGKAHIITSFGAGPEKDAAANTAAIQRAIDSLGKGGGLVYVPAGIFAINNVVLRSRVTLYLDGNAVLRAADDARGMPENFTKPGVYALDATDAAGKRVLETRGGTFLISTDPRGTTDAGIHGRGMIDGNGYYLRRNALWLTTLVMARNAVNFTMDGVTGWDGGFWAVMTVHSPGPMSITNYKGLQSLGYFDPSLGPKGYSDMSQDDGIDVCNSSRVTVRHALIVSKDDSYSTKSLHNGSGLSKYWSDPQTNATPPPMKDILFTDAVGWSTTRVFKIGEGNNFGTEGVTFDHGYVYRSRNALSIDTTGGTAATKNIVFSNMDVELTTANQNGKPHDDTWFDVMPKEGPVNNVAVFNVNTRGTDSVKTARFTSYPAAPISDVSFTNVTVDGARYTSNQGMPAYVTVRAYNASDPKTIHPANVYDAARGVECSAACGPIANGASLTYSVDVGAAPVSTLYLRVASMYSGAVEIHDGDASGKLIGVTPIPITGDWHSFETVPVPIGALTGKHTLTFVAVRDDGTPFFHLDWFSF